MATIKGIQNKWQQATKIKGSANVITLADGGTLTGCYYLCEAGSVTASHDALNGFIMSAGFPTDDNGGSINDRDYSRDRDAQQITRNIAASYDSRAIQNAVIVSHDGVVLSGNGRTMAGELAARDNTDRVYIDYLKQYGSVYGFNAGEVSRFCHPRIVFVINDALPYTAATFARFNAQEMKGQSKTEQAIKYGKMVDDATFGRILSTINAFDTLSDFYASTEAALRCIKELQGIGVVTAMQLAEMTDGDTLSTSGRETLENVLIGKAFAGYPDAARQIASYRNVRRTIVTALAEVANNIALTGGYSLAEELTKAVSLCYQARKEGDYKEGERVSDFARQITIFDGGTVAEVGSDTVMMLADTLNSTKTTLLRKFFAVYNHQATDAANGQTDMFCETGVKTKSGILQDVRALFAEGTAQEQNNAVKESVQQRTGENIFIAEEQLTHVVAGSYVEYRTKSGETIVCRVEAVRNLFATLIAKGGLKFTANVLTLTPTASHNLTYPSWLQVGAVITDGVRSSQRIAHITESHVIFDWINGGCYEAHLTTILQNWKPSETGKIEILEAA